MQLRPYQEEAVQSIFREWSNGNKKTLLVMATGCGKTVVFSKVAEQCVREGKRVLILAHRKELLDQAEDKILKSTGLVCSVERGNESAFDNPWNRITVGSVQTMMREDRLNKFDTNHFDVIIIDEAHHAPSSSYQQVLNYFSNANVLGVTATADRADRKNLGEVFDSLAFEYDMAKAIKEGYLSPIRTQTIPLNIDLTSVSISAGDFKAGDVGRVLDPYLDNIAEEMVTYCKYKKTVVFLPLIETSQRFCEILNAKGFKAEEVNGTSDDRDAILDRFQKGKTNVLCNSMLLTEGWDCPTVDCVICLRPTKSRSLYVQIVGRGTRLAPGKEHLLLLDFLWHIEKHTLCRPAMLLAKNEEVEKRMTAIALDGDMYDLEALEMEAERDVLAEREAALQKELEAQRKRKRQFVDPLQYEFSIQDEALTSYVPSFGWEVKPATPKQKEIINKFGVDTPSDLTTGKATLLIDTLIKRKEAGLSTAKQIRLLERYGFVNVGTWPFDVAQNMISRICAANWSIPKGVKVKEFKP